MLDHHPKIRMILMMATSNNCKKIAELISSDKLTIDEILEYVSDLNFSSLSEKDFDKIAELISEAVQTVVFKGLQTPLQKISALEMKVQEKTTEEIATILLGVSSETAKPEHMSIYEMDIIVLWCAIQNVLTRIPLCSHTIKSSTAYKKQNTKNKDADKTTDNKLKETQEKVGFSFSKISKICRSVVGSS